MEAQEEATTPVQEPSLISFILNRPLKAPARSASDDQHSSEPLLEYQPDVDSQSER